MTDKEKFNTQKKASRETDRKILHALAEGPKTSAEIERAANITPKILNLHISPMKERGEVNRTLDPRDGRKLWYATENCLPFLEEIYKAQVAQVQVTGGTISLMKRNLKKQAGAFTP
jgi:DNA-binding HxlR family transcriptional regulator